MTNWLHKTEALANIAIIVVAVLVGVVLVKNYLLSNGAESNPPARIKAGDKISLQDVDWAKAEQTVLLALSKDCHFCTESAGFYRQLIQESNQNTAFRIIAISAQEPDEVKGYLNQLGLSINEVRQASLPTLNIMATPTIVLMDNKGAVKRAWFGKLPADKETEVLNELRAKTAANCCD
jgi:peroxiredoxin